jgi:hypothetical protein
MLVRLLYASCAAEPITSKELDDILAKSRANNPDLGITGLLCVADDVYIQVLEGGRMEVCDLYNTIVRDGRHTDVCLLQFEEISERQFGQWTMGRADVSRINPVLLLKYFEKPALNPFDASGKATMALLTEMVDTGAIVTRPD